MTLTYSEVITLFFITSVVFSLVLILITYLSLRKMLLPFAETGITKAVTVLKCPLCNYVVKRAFREGDHIGAVSSETCPIHNMNLIVYEIYTESPTRSE